VQTILAQDSDHAFTLFFGYTKYVLPLETRGKFHDQGDAKWIVIRRSLWGHNDMPSRRPAPGQPIGRPGPGRPPGIVGVFQLLLIGDTDFSHCPPDLGIHRGNHDRNFPCHSL
jgi:hypothetical protein